MDGASLILRAAADLDLAPTGLGVEDEQRTIVEYLDLAAGTWSAIHVHIKTDDFRAARASGIAQQHDPVARADHMAGSRPSRGCPRLGSPPSEPARARAFAWSRPARSRYDGSCDQGRSPVVRGFRRGPTRTKDRRDIARSFRMKEAVAPRPLSDTSLRNAPSPSCTP